MRKARIQEIQPEQADIIMETRQPLGLFYVRLASVYLGIDNSHGDAWTEAFSRLSQCKRWLRDPNICEGMFQFEQQFQQKRSVRQWDGRSGKREESGCQQSF